MMNLNSDYEERRGVHEYPPLREYNFWNDYIDKFGTKECPVCGKQMGVRKVKEHLNWFCESCLHCDSLKKEDYAFKESMKGAKMNKEEFQKFKERVIKK